MALSLLFCHNSVAKKARKGMAMNNTSNWFI
jgi:hypothetical protein